MHKHITILFGLLCLLGVSAGASADELKIGFVNPIRIMDEAPQAAAARAALEKEFSGRQKLLEEERSKVQKMEERLNRDGAVMSEAERRKLERDVFESQRDFKRAQQEFNDDLKYKQNEAMGQLQRDVVKAIADVGRGEKFDLVVSEGVVYASDRIDITEKVLQKLGKKK